MSHKLEPEAMILGALKDGPLHGYRISQAIRVQGQGLFKLGDNQIYPILHRLEMSGQVKAEWQHQEGKPSRKVYSLTEEGGKRLEVYRKEWDRYVTSFSALIGREGAAHV